MGEPEDLSGCSRTVFGVKILCGLMMQVNPQSRREDWGFFLRGVRSIVIPAKAGIQGLMQNHWIPGQARNDCKGMK